jgi:hypothetical protein
MDRQTGKTTRQMRAAPKGAVFIWCNAQLDYPRILAKRIGREDLRIKSPTWLERAYLGHEYLFIVVDHAARLTGRQYEGYYHAIAQWSPGWG